MNGMTVQERIDDIVQKSGLSEEIVRRVLIAEKQSVVDSIKRGERATLIGRCVIVPELRSRLSVGNTFKKTLKLNVSIANSLMADLKEVEEFERSDIKTSEPEGVLVMQLSSLT